MTKFLKKNCVYEVNYKLILQFLALRNPLPKIFLYKICAKWRLVVCANTLLLLEHYLTKWVFIWKHSIDLCNSYIFSGNISYLASQISFKTFSEKNPSKWQIAPISRIYLIANHLNKSLIQKIQKNQDNPGNI